MDDYPYFQHTYVPTQPSIGALTAVSTFGGATGNHSFMRIHRCRREPAHSLRILGTTGKAANGAPNLLYGPGSNAWSITFTPTYQHDLRSCGNFPRRDQQYDTWPNLRPKRHQHDADPRHARGGRPILSRGLTRCARSGESAGYRELTFRFTWIFYAGVSIYGPWGDHAGIAALLTTRSPRSSSTTS